MLFVELLLPDSLQVNGLRVSPRRKTLSPLWAMWGQSFHSASHCLSLRVWFDGNWRSRNFPASIKAIAEYFPKKERAFATTVFNSGAQIGALLAPLTVPFIAKAFGWEMSFIIIGGVGFIWSGFGFFIP